MKLPLLSQNSNQSRREARGLVISIEQRATPSGMILASTHAAEAIFLPRFVVNRSLSKLNNPFSATLVKKLALGSGGSMSANRP